MDHASHGESWEIDGSTFEVTEGGDRTLSVRVGPIFFGDEPERSQAVWVEGPDVAIALSPETWRALRDHVDGLLGDSTESCQR